MCGRESTVQDLFEPMYQTESECRMIKRERLRGSLFFFGIFALLAYGVFVLIRPFFNIIAVALFTVLMLKPVYGYLLHRKWLRGRRRLATTLTVLGFILLLVVPLIWLGSVVISSASNFFEYVGSEGARSSLGEMLAEAENFMDGILPAVGGIEFDREAVLSWLIGLVTGAAGWLANLAVSLGTSIPQLMVTGILFLALVVTLLPAYDDIIARLQELSPLDVDISQRYIHKATVMVISMIKGIFLIAIIQGLVMGLFFRLANLPFTWFLTILSMAFAIIPAVGISFIVLPLAAILFLLGNTQDALIVLFGFYGVVNWIDTLLRPKLVSREAYFNFALILLSVFGGMAVAGVLGIIYGPVLMILFLTSIEIYAEHYGRARQAAELESVEAEDGVVEGESPAEAPV
jgi:predicted PurR-regulated permease PerM